MGTIEIKPLEMFSGSGLKTWGAFTTLDMAESWGDCSEKWESEEFDHFSIQLHFRTLSQLYVLFRG